MMALLISRNSLGENSRIRTGLSVRVCAFGKKGGGKEWTPQIVLGLDDPTSHADHGGGELVSGNTSGSNNYATRYYLAVTKHLDVQNIGEWGIHAAFVYGNAKGIEHYKRPSFGTNFRFQLLGDQPLIKVVNNLT